MTIDRLPIKAKLFILPAIAAAGLLATVLTSQIGSQKMAASAQLILEKGEENSAAVQQLNTAIERAVALVRAAPSEIDIERLAGSRAAFETLVQSLGESLPAAADMSLSSDSGISDLAAFSAAGQKVFDLAGQFAQHQATETVEGEFSSAQEAMVRHVVSFQDQASAASAALLQEIRQARHDMDRRLVLTGLAVFLLGAGISVLIARNLSRRMSRLQAQMSDIADGELGQEIDGTSARDELGKMARALAVFRDGLMEKAEQMARQEAEKDAMRAEAERERQANFDRQSTVMTTLGEGLRNLASGQLDVEISQTFPDEYEVIRGDFNTAIRNLTDMVTLISKGGEEIQGVSDRVADAASKIAHRSERNAAAMEESSAALNELTVSVSKTSEEAGASSKTAAKAKSKAQDGAHVVAEAIAAMDRIRAASSKISSIIEVIEGISFQTNLLALNASVEAARAGDAGSGFAVVAKEVRALAHRSSEAAKEISDLIEEEATNVKHGAELVGKTGDALSEITRSVETLAESIGTIAEAAMSQSAGIKEINVSVSEIDKLTQQNAGMFEETRSATQTLKHRSSDLAAAISQFSIGAPTSAIAAE